MAVSISVAVVGCVGLFLNLRAALQSDSASTRNLSQEEEPQSEPVATAAPQESKSAEASARPPSKPFRPKQELAELLKKSQEESKDCKASVDKARAKLSKSLMSAEEFKQALKLLEETPLTPPSSQEIYLAFEEGMPVDWDGATFLDQVMSAGGCDTVIHYKLLKSVVEKAAKHPERFPLTQIRSAARGFLTLGSDKPSPLSVEMMRISLLKDMAQNKEIDSQFEQKVTELKQQGQSLLDNTKSLPNEFEKSKGLREAYVRLLKEIWPN
ncbi:MAG: hypothetical protein ACJ763_11285 [Bdellovibrionia bacterium]